MKKVIVGFVVVVALLAGSMANADVTLATLDGGVDYWNPGVTIGQPSTVLAVIDGAYAGQNVGFTFIRFDLPTLAPGWSFDSAKLQMYPTGFHSWTSGSPSTIPAQFRVYETAAFNSTTTWNTQPGDIGLLDAKYYGMANVGSWIDWGVLSAMGSGKALYLRVDNNRDAVGGGGGGGFWFHSIEAGAAPRIEYTIIPEPATMGLLLIGTVLGLRTKRSK